jgi:Na+/citrate or Na+/malate symporter
MIGCTNNTVLFYLFFRSLQLLSLNDAKMLPSFAKMIIYTLLESSCGLQTLDISENNVGSHENVSFFLSLIFVFWTANNKSLIDFRLAFNCRQKFYKFFISTRIKYIIELLDCS